MNYVDGFVAAVPTATRGLTANTPRRRQGFQGIRCTLVGGVLGRRRAEGRSRRSDGGQAQAGRNGDLFVDRLAFAPDARCRHEEGHG